MRGGLLLSTSQRENQVERCASGEAVIIGGLVVGPEGFHKDSGQLSDLFLGLAIIPLRLLQLAVLLPLNWSAVCPMRRRP